MPTASPTDAPPAITPLDCGEGRHWEPTTGECEADVFSEVGTSTVAIISASSLLVCCAAFWTWWCYIRQTPTERARAERLKNFNILDCNIRGAEGGADVESSDGEHADDPVARAAEWRERDAATRQHMGRAIERLGATGALGAATVDAARSAPVTPAGAEDLPRSAFALQRPPSYTGYSRPRGATFGDGMPAVGMGPRPGPTAGRARQQRSAIGLRDVLDAVSGEL